MPHRLVPNILGDHFIELNNSLLDFFEEIDLSPLYTHSNQAPYSMVLYHTMFIKKNLLCKIIHLCVM